MMKFLTISEYSDIIVRVGDLEKQVKELQNSPSEVFYDNKQFLAVMGIAPRTAHQWRNEGLICCSQIGAKIYYKHSDILEMLLKHQMPPSKKKIP